MNPHAHVESIGSAGPFDALNPDQRTAVVHGQSPLLVIAGAGTGKTLMLAARVAHLVHEGVDPQRLLLLTFSRRAAETLARRAGMMLHRLLGLRATQAQPEMPWAGTFHAVGARLLREYAGAIGLPADFTIADRADAEDLMGLVRESLGLAESAQRFPLAGTCVAIASRCVNMQAPLREVLQRHYPWCAGHHDALQRLLRAYAAEKLAQATLDYDDLLLAWRELLRDPALAAQQAQRFDHILVDEYQDTNRLQAGILRALRPDGRGLTVVGDDAQAIYGFRAAEVGNILDFATEYGPHTCVLALQRNYRSTQPILDAANAVIARAGRGHAKRLWTEMSTDERPRLVTLADESAQARWVADTALARREEGIALKAQAVLFRTGHHSAALELELARRGIPFTKYGGLKFLEAAHVRDLLAILRWAHNPRSRLAAFRVIRLVPGIGPSTARRAIDHMQQAADVVAAFAAFAPPAASRAEWRALSDLIGALQGDGSRWPADVELALRWYRPHLQRRHPDDHLLRAADLDALARLAAVHPSRAQFLADLTLDPPEATSDLPGPPQRDDDWLVLSTIHAAKGQEWTAVSVLNVVDGCLPADMAAGSADEIDEERRLLYVAMTRARRHLDLLVPLRFHVTQQRRLGDRHLYGGRSRFITPEVAALCDEVRPATAEGWGTPVPPLAASIDVGRALLARWD